MNVYDSIMQGLNEAVEYTEGNQKIARVERIKVIPIYNYNATEIKTIRGELGMTQSVFALVMGVSKKTVEAWEQGINTPSGSSCRLLYFYKMNPKEAEKLIKIV